MSTKKLLTVIIGLIVLSGLVMGIYHMVANKGGKVSDSSAYAEYISAYSSGIIPKKSAITVKLTEYAAAQVQQDQVNLEDIFSFSPSVSGKTYWVDKQTIEFKPDADLPSDTRFVAEFDLGRLLKVPESLSSFVFEFRTVKQNFDVSV
jgi:hypothetical protein